MTSRPRPLPGSKANRAGDLRPAGQQNPALVSNEDASTRTGRVDEERSLAAIPFHRWAVAVP